MKINKRQILTYIEAICEDLLDNVISPICGIESGIWADIFRATLGDYGTLEQGEAMVKEICRRYNLKSIDGEDFIAPIETNWSLASLALYIYFNTTRCDFYMVENCDFCNKHGCLICGPYDNLICLNCADKFSKGEIQ